MHPVLVDEPHLLVRVLHARRQEKGPDAGHASAVSVATALRRPERTTEKVASASTSVPNAVAAEAAVSQLMEATTAQPVIDVILPPVARN